MPVMMGSGLPNIVKRLLIINVAIFVLTTVFIQYQGLIYYVFGLVPRLVNGKFMIWQFVTYMFLHGGMGHIFFNMFALWMFGAELEYNWGERDFILYYFLCGIGGGLLVWLTAFIGLSSASAPTIGASGAIFGLLVAYGLMWPDRQIYIWGILPMKALHLVILFAGIDLFNGLTGGRNGIAVFAHLGGGLTGFIYLKYGWKISVQIEGFMNRWKRRKFTVVDGGQSKSSKKSDTPDKGEHPDFDVEVDRILDKIAKNGMDSLSKRERNILDRASNRRKK